MIYFDNAATTAMSPNALKAYLEVSQNAFGNPESTHAWGRKAERLLGEARKGILACLGLSDTHDLVFTSGATEANNLAIKSVLKAYSRRGNRVISSYYEHPSVLKTLRGLAGEGLIDLVLLKGDSYGVVSPQTLGAAMDSSTLLVCLMGVNNELGSISPYAGYSEIVSKFPKCFYLCDFTQGAGKRAFGAPLSHFVTFSSHKFAGPKGVGGLIMKKNISLSQVTGGGEQEGGRRPGTVDVAGAYSSYVALKEETRQMPQNGAKIMALRGYLWSELGRMIEEITINSPSDGSPYILNFSLKRKKASVVAEALSRREIYVGTVSACSSKNALFSYVLRDAGHSEGDSENSIRLSFGSGNELEEGKLFMAALKDIISEVKDRG